MKNKKISDQLNSMSDSTIDSLVKIAGTPQDGRLALTHDQRVLANRLWGEGKFKNLHQCALFFGVSDSCMKRVLDPRYEEEERARKAEVERNSKERKEKYRTKNGEKIKQGICNRIEKKKKILSSTPADHQLLGQVSPEVSKEIKSLVNGIGRVLDEK